MEMQSVAPVTSANAAKKIKAKLPRFQELGLILVILVLGGVLTTYGWYDARAGRPNTFLNFDNLVGGIATPMSYYAIMAIGVTFVVITGGILGIVAMRLVVGQLITLVQRYPALVDGAFVIIAWVGLKLGMEYLFDAGYIELEIPRWLSLSLIVVIFCIAFVYARMQGAAPEVDPLTEQAEVMLASDDGDDRSVSGLE